MRILFTAFAVLSALGADAFAQEEAVRAGACVLRRVGPEENARLVASAPPAAQPAALAAGTPDLVATGLLLVTTAGGETTIAAPAVGQSVYVNFTFENQGTGSASNFSIEISIDGYIYCPYAGAIDAPPGSVWTLSCPSPWIPESGLHQLAGRVDVANVVAELSESNNMALRIVPVPVSLSARTAGDPPGSYARDVWFSARHKEAVGAWFVPPVSGSLDTLWWVMGDSIGAKDSVVTVMFRRSRVSALSGPGHGYPVPPSSWGRWANTNDADQGIAPFPEEATDTAWISTVAGASESFPPVAETRWGGRAVTVRRNSVAALPVAGLMVERGETLFVALRVNSADAHVSDPPTMFAAGRPASASSSRLWKFYEHDAPASGFSKGWVARGEFNLLLWCSITAVPVIASFAPQSAAPGASVAIAGSGFAADPESMLVRFGGVSGELLAATETTLTVVVPVGSACAPLTVTNLSTHRTASSRASFSVLFPGNSGVGTDAFARPVALGSAFDAPGFPAIGDLDGDGKPDLAVADGNALRLFRNESATGFPGGGSFVSALTVPAGAFALDPVLSDLDGDGRLDLAVSCRDASSLAIARNTGSPGAISFAVPTLVALPGSPRRLSAADLDGDGRIDLAAASDAGLLLLRNESTPGTLAFAPPAVLEPGLAASSIAAADIDGDSRIDLCFADPGRSAVSVARNLSTAGGFSFAPRRDVALGSGASALEVSDLDRDGTPDLSVLRSGGAGLRVFRNESTFGNFSLGAGVDLADGGGSDLHAADIDGDGLRDLAAVSGAALRVFRNQGVPGTIEPGSFAPGVDFALGAAPSGFAVCDLDGDAQADIVASCAGEASVHLLRNMVRFVIIRAFDRLGSAFATGPREVGATLVDEYPEHPESALVASAAIRVSVNGVPQGSVGMTRGPGSAWSGALPGGSAGSYTEYRIVAANARGYLDSTGPVRYHTLTLGYPAYGIDTGCACSGLPAGLAAAAIDSARFFVPGAGQGPASGSGTAGPVSLGGPFPFFGEVVEYAWIGVDGAVALTSSFADSADLNAGGEFNPAWDVPWPARTSRADEPFGTTMPGNLVAPFYHDASLRGGGAIRAASDESLFAVEWDSLSAIAPSGEMVGRPLFRALLHRGSGAIEFQYDRLGGDRVDSLPLVALQGDSGSYAYLSKNGSPPSLRPRDGWCVRFFPAHPTHVASQGWNLISVPTREADMARSAVYPASSSSAFSFENGYVVRPALECGVGYWLKFPAATATVFRGEPSLRETIEVAAGWNLIGSIARSVAVGSITSDPPGIVTTQFFGFRNGYAATGTIEPGRAYWVKSSAAGRLMLAGEGEGSAWARIVVVATGEEPPQPPGSDAGRGGELPSACTIGQNFPNPFNMATVLRYALPSDSRVRLSLYNVLGEEVALLIDEARPAGWHEISVDAGSLPSGVYLCRLKAGEFDGARKVLLVK